MNPEMFELFRKNKKNSFNYRYRGPKCGSCFKHGDGEHNEIETNAKKFEDLDVKCIENIKFLPWTDLMAMRRTCRTFKAEVDRFIKLKNQHGTIIVWGENEITSDENIPEEFHPFIRTIIVQIHYLNETMDVFHSINNRCVNDIRSLSITIQLQTEGSEELAFDQILAQLDSLTMLELQGQISLAILEHCNNLQHLRINQSELAGDNNGAWTNKTYPKMKTLAIHTANTQTDLETFLQKNPQLEAVAIDFREINDIQRMSSVNFKNFKLKLGILIRRETENEFDDFDDLED